MTIQYLPANESTYLSLQSFGTIDEMNATVKQHKKLVSSAKQKNIYAVLDLISQYSCVYFGVSWLSINRISDLLGISYKTTQRALERLVELNIIVKHACKRVDGDKRQTSNVYVIQSIQIESDLPQVSDQKAPSLNSKSINTDVTEAPVQKSDNEQVIKDALLSKLPEPLRVLGYFFDATAVHKYAGCIYKAKHAIDRTIAIEEHSQAFETTIKQVISSFKLGKIRNFESVLYCAIRALCKSIKLKSQFASVFGN